MTLSQVCALAHAGLVQLRLVDGLEPVQDELLASSPSERLHVTERVCWPSPQDTEQSDHEPVSYEYE